MAFWGCSFSFNGIPCEDFDLMMYEIDGTSHSSGKFASGVSISEDIVSHRWKPFFYGTQFKDKLTFSIVFGVNQTRVDRQQYLERDELEVIATWLTGHNEYLWLEIYQEDLEPVRYKCIVTALDIVELETVPWALKATIVCDSPYAYRHPQTYEYVIDGETAIDFYNESSLNGYYMPIIEFALNGSQSFSIVNQSDNNRQCAFSGLPSAIRTVRIDNDHCIVTTNDNGINPYPYFNFNFVKFVKGDNRLIVTGNGVMRIICEFPVNVGG